MKISKILLVLVAAAATTLSGWAQSEPPPGSGPHNGTELRQMLAAHRESMTQLMEQRRALLEAIYAAAPEEREALRLQLRELMLAQQQEHRELAKAIREAVRARRDQRPTPPPGG